MFNPFTKLQDSKRAKLSNSVESEKKKPSSDADGLGKNEKFLLRNFNGVLKAGEMALVVGRPGSGCTTFLKVSFLGGSSLRSRPSPATRLPSPSF